MRRRCWLVLGGAVLLASCGSPTVETVGGAPELGDCRPRPRPESCSGCVAPTAVTLAERWMASHPPEELGFDWGPAVLLDALLELYERTGDERLRTYVWRWAWRWRRHYPVLWSDTVAPAGVVARLARWGCEAEFLALADAVWTWLLHDAPRTPEGGIGHLGLLLPQHPQLWIDSLYMWQLFLDAYATLRSFEAPRRLYEEQWRLFARLLQDASGWFRHAWVHGAPFPREPAFWARGNGWIVAAGLRALQRRRESEVRGQFVRVLEPLLRAAAAAQDPGSGLWWSVVNRPGFGGLESSGSALIALGLRDGRAFGLPAFPAAVARARRGLTTRILPDERHLVTGISGPTQPGTAAAYAAVPLTEDLDYGVGAVLWYLMGVTGPTP